MTVTGFGTTTIATIQSEKVNSNGTGTTFYLALTDGAGHAVDRYFEFRAILVGNSG